MTDRRLTPATAGPREVDIPEGPEWWLRHGDRINNVANAAVVFASAGALFGISFAAAWAVVDWVGSPFWFVTALVAAGLVFGAAAGWIHTTRTNAKDGTNESARPNATGTGWTPPL
jgi:hypothetical protein